MVVKHAEHDVGHGAPQHHKMPQVAPSPLVATQVVGLVVARFIAGTVQLASGNQ
jgi:hypothetical protein